MKKFVIPFIVVLGCFVIACNNSDKKHDHGTGDAPKNLADSLMKFIDDGHMVGMSKIGKLHNTQKEVQRVLDSLKKLPAKAQQAAEPYINQLNAVIKDLEYADFAMDKWMTEFDMDSALDKMEQRIRYLTDEKLKVSKMKEAILGSLQKADSLLKAKL
ncbi:MAG: viral A-type inclusion protein [Ferruginibacter sp.]|nr:viral A-type inclusion protein [Chitinophagaceae bacterium]